MADITHVFKATLKTIQTRNKALGRINREGSSGLSKDGTSSSFPLSSSPTNDPIATLFSNHNGSSKNGANNHKGSKSEFNLRAKDIIVKITKLRDFLLRHRMDYINIHSHLIFEQVRSMTDAERDQVDGNAQAVMRSCGEEIRLFRSDLTRQKLRPQVEEHRSITITMIDTYMKVVCKIFSEMKAVRVKRVLDRKRLSRIGGNVASKRVENAVEASHKRLKLTKEEDDGGEERATTPPPLDAASPSADVDAASLDDADSDANSPTTLNDAASERGGNASTTWASTSFDDDVDVDRIADNLSAEEIQMFEQENAFLIDELQNTTDDVKKIEGQVIEIARLQEIFSEKILQQEGDISRIGENLTGTTENLQMANEQIREAIKNNAGFRVWILFFLVVMTFSLLFLDWYND